MTSALLIVAALLGGLAILVREGLILAGLLKGPILHGYEKYGDEEPFYYPLPGLLVGLCVLATGLGHWMAPYVGGLCLPMGPAILLMFAAYEAYRRESLARKHAAVFQAYPRWCRVLREYTTREERRRIAYLWLGLPWKTRVLFNSSDRAFLQWADLIVLATVT